MRTHLAALAIAAVAALGLASCETMSAEECAAADWRAIGYSDGAQGSNRFSARQESCARKGFGADLNAYLSGNAEGARFYCTPQRGFQRGLSGTGYAGFCPPDLDGAFSAAHADGLRAYQVTTALSAAENEQRRLENRRGEIDTDIRNTESQLAQAATDEERGRLRNELGRLNDERRRVNDDIRTQMREVRYRSEDLDRARYDIGNRWGPW